MNRLTRSVALATLPLWLGACALAPRTPPADTAPTGPAAWQAPLPHAGSTGELARWWQQFDDPLLAPLIEAAQQASPTLAQSRSRVEQARATRTASGAALAPSLNATASASRGRQDVSAPLGTSLSAGLQAAWEIDLFGANAAGRDAAQARLDAAASGWHEARVAVAAEVASSYLDLRACEAQLVTTRQDAASRAETARLTGLSANAGFQAPASAALARASAAQGNATLTQLQASCDRSVKALVALTALDEPTLRSRMAQRTARLPQPTELGVARVPAEVLNQRPDVDAAARELLAASADVDQAQAQRLPRIALSGNLGAARFDSGATTLDGTVWSLGPLSVSLPLFDAGTRRANVVAARARYDAAASAYRGTLRTAVREVEEALLTLQSTAARDPDARTATDGFEASYRATEARYQGGLASLFELEDARRSAVQANSALIDLQRERVAAWIALYRALGGGWNRADSTAALPTDPAAAPR